MFGIKLDKKERYKKERFKQFDDWEKRVKQTRILRAEWEASRNKKHKDLRNSLLDSLLDSLKKCAISALESNDPEDLRDFSLNLINEYTSIEDVEKQRLDYHWTSVDAERYLRIEDDVEFMFDAKSGILLDVSIEEDNWLYIERRQ